MSPSTSGPSTLVSARRAAESSEADEPIAPSRTEPPPPNPSGPNTALSTRRKPSDTAPSGVPSERLANRYVLKRKIGEGGMGTVWVATDTELDREVAIKMLAANLANDAEVLERFEREARLTARLDHPNIVPVYDVGRHDGCPFIVMKLLEGETLTGLLRTKGGLTSDEALKLMRQLAAGLDYLHGKGFIHRDVKSGNVIIAPDGHATILDFGILRSRKTASNLTRAGMVMGTPHYMAPEQAMGLKDVDHRVDLYALAVVLFECLTGTLPFEADSELRLIHMQAHSPPPEIVDRAPWIPKTVADVVKKGLSKKPAERFNSGAEFVSALELAYRDSGGHLAAPRSPKPNVGITTGSGLKVLEKLSAATTSSPRLPAVARGPASKAALPAVSDTAPSPASWPRRLVGAGVALALLVVGVLAFVRTEPASTDGRPAVTGPLEPSASLGADAGASLSEPDGGALAIIEPEDAGVEPEPRVVVEAAPAVPDAGRPLAATGTPRRRNGQLNVITMHAGEPYWAQVSIDGVPRGRTPLNLDLPVGRYHMRVERPGFRVEERPVLISASKPVVVKIDLRP